MGSVAGLGWARAPSVSKGRLPEPDRTLVTSGKLLFWSCPQKHAQLLHKSAAIFFCFYLNFSLSLFFSAHFDDRHT